MTWDQVVELLQKVGFPIFVAGWFMFRHEKRMDRQARLLTQLMMGVQMLARSVDGLESFRPAPSQRLSTQPPFAFDVDDELDDEPTVSDGRVFQERDTTPSMPVARDPRGEE